ncbi:MAG: tetraacyldisaccharide 4'-kinase [Pyrinomonadaceae bacterium]
MLTPIGWIYGKIIDVRNTLYEKNVFDSRHLGARTISVGNITTGGTGKTPLVAYVAEILAARGETVCILTRGFGRSQPNRRVLVSDRETILAKAGDAGDEPLELAQKLIGKAYVISDADRTAAGEWAKRKFDITAFVLDDGFQHRKVLRDLDIVSIDAMHPFGDRKMLPAGRLREPITNLKRADAIVISRADLVENIDDLRSEIATLNKRAPIFVCRNEISRIRPLNELRAGILGNTFSGEWRSIEQTVKGRPTKVAAFCALGNPDSFFETLRRSTGPGTLGTFDVAITQAFRDHRPYSQKDIDALQRDVVSNGIDAFVTTSKDAVKLQDFKFDIPCFVADIELKFDDADDFAELL